MRGACEACQRVGEMHECVACKSQVCLSCIGRDGCRACKAKPKK